MVLPRSFEKKNVKHIFIAFFITFMKHCCLYSMKCVYESNYEYGRQLEKIINMKSFIEYKKEQLKK